MGTQRIDRPMNRDEELQLSRALLAIAIDRLGGTLLAGHTEVVAWLMKTPLVIHTAPSAGGAYSVTVAPYVRPADAVAGRDYPRGDE